MDRYRKLFHVVAYLDRRISEIDCGAQRVRSKISSGGSSKAPRSIQTATASFPEQRDQAHHLPIFLRRKALLKPAKPPIDSLHHLLCLFGDCGAGRSTSSDIETRHHLLSREELQTETEAVSDDQFFSAKG
jgi:hypothetical protein